MRKFTYIWFLAMFASGAFSQVHEKIYINEFLASNVSIDADMVDFDDYSDWLELYNDEHSEVDISGYFLTDDPDLPTRWKIPDGTVIPAKGFLRFWADGYDEKPGKTHVRPWPNYLNMTQPELYFSTDYYHLNFSLSRAGEYIGLYNPDGLVVDSVSFGLQQRDVSMGRKPDGGSEWFYFGEPTPQTSNHSDGIATVISAGIPAIAPASGFYEGTQTVDITSDTSLESIKFTLEGSKPGSSSAVYDLPFNVNQTTVLRARIFEDGKLPGPIVNRSYFLNEQFALPVISIITPPQVLWDDHIGIYENRLKGREIPIAFHYFSPEGQTLLDIRAGLRLTGQVSLYCPQVSFTITARDRYGTDEIACRIFRQRELNSYKSLYLRNSGVPDNWDTHFRDAMTQSLVINKMDIDCQAFQPAALFLNGKYWGIYNIRDKVNADYIASLHNLNPDDLDLLEYASGQNEVEVMEGNTGNYTDFFQYFVDNDLSVEENYRFIESWMDIDEYINYQISEIYFDNTTWPNINVRMWRERKEGAKWRWILFDTDFGFGMPNPGSSGYTNNTLAYATSSDNFPQAAPAWSTLIFRRLLKNEEFKMKFIQRFAAYLNSVFHPDTVVRVISDLENTLAPEMGRHINRWKYEEPIIEGAVPIPSYNAWYSSVRVMKEFARKRARYQRQHIISHFNLGGSSVLHVTINSPGSGRVLVNEAVKIDSSASGIYFRDVPVSFRALPEVGYRFVRWEGIVEDSVEYVNVLPDADTIVVTAHFDTVSINVVPDNLSSDTTLSIELSPYYATGDIIVPPDRTLTIESGVELLMPEKASIMVYGRLIVNGTGEEPVEIRPNEYAERWGALCFVEASDSSVISHLNISGATRGKDFAQNPAAISGYKSSFTLNNLSIVDSDMPLFVQYGNVAVRECLFRADRAGDLINIKNADYALVEDCDLRGNDHYDSDAIDYDGISSGIIRGNRIYNFYGFNSDAIDLGEGCRNILVENNMVYNINDKGVSIGNGSTATIRRNLFANCGQGLGIKDFGSYGYSEHNTFYANGYGIACFVKNIGAGGGRADIVNCIIADSRIASVWADEQSSANVSYSLINSDEPGGLHNIYDQPGFSNNLYLSAQSPALNSGNPTLPNDPDGSLPDMGAYPYDSERISNLFFNEIHYNPTEGANSAFIELINKGNKPVQLKDFSLSGDIDYTFPDDVISPDELILVAKNKTTYEGNGYTVFEWEDGNLMKGPGSIILNDDRGEMIDFVNYHNRFWWPHEPDGSGPSLELHDAGLENMVSSNWRSSFSDGGTPGRASNSELLSGIYINEFMANNNSVHTDEFGDYDDWIELYNSTDKPLNIAGLYITDNLVDPFKHRIPLHNLPATTVPAGGFLLLWADGETEEGVLHLGFRLDQAGEEIGLIQRYENSASYIDSLSYSTQVTDISYGRYPDGSVLHHLNVPTPLASNIYTGARARSAPSAGFTLFQNYPNPFHFSTTIHYHLATFCNVELCIYDLSGRKVTTLVIEKQPAGIHEVEWRTTGLESGVYFGRLRTGQSSQIIKMISIN